MRFKCSACDEWHQGVPGFSSEAPLYLENMPPEELEARCELTSETCVIDGAHFFARGCIEIPVIGEPDPFIWGVWVSLSEASFRSFQATLEGPCRSVEGPFFGWLSTEIFGYPPCENLRTMLYLRDDGVRPYIELEPTDHPLAVEQREGISVARVAEIYAGQIRWARGFPDA